MVLVDASIYPGKDEKTNRTGHYLCNFLTARKLINVYLFLVCVHTAVLRPEKN